MIALALYLGPVSAAFFFHCNLLCTLVVQSLVSKYVLLAIQSIAINTDEET